VFRDEWAALVAAVVRMLGDLDRAEEIVQEALVVAIERWPEAGVPDRPGAWLMTVVRNRALDELRRRSTIRRKHEELAAQTALEEQAVERETPNGIPDDRLRLVFICCHPQLPSEARVALTLRMIGGLSTRDIARAFLVSESTISQRIVRAKRAVKDRGLPYRVPEAAELPDRLPGVLEVLYLIFNEGYSAGQGDELLRRALCDEAIRLTGMLDGLLPGEAEVLGLWALMEFQASRHATRTDSEGDLVLLPDQDRERWDRVQIERASRHLDAARHAGPLGRYGLQAMIAESHARARNWDATDWHRIVQCYDALHASTDSPVVALNRAVAVAMRDGPGAGLEELDAVASHPKLAAYALLPATRADLLRRLGRLDEAAAEYREAIARSANARERTYLERRLDECSR
jgi:RNA polymerase sigma factor (sigma-70 family)